MSIIIPVDLGTAIAAMHTCMHDARMRLSYNYRRNGRGAPQCHAMPREGAQRATAEDHAALYRRALLRYWGA
jgi:hypothetical protein